MRVLLVDHDTEGLEAIARAIRGVIDFDCVTSKGDALLLLRQNAYDVLIACERAVDGSGLDLLGRTTKTAVPLKRIFAAAPERLQLLGPRLAPFKVQRTINYPIDLEELWLAIAQVTSGPDDDTDGTIERVVLDERGQSSSTSRSGVRRAPNFPPPLAPAAAPVANTIPAPVPAPTPMPMVAQAPAAPVVMTAANGQPRAATVARVIPNPQTPPAAPRAAPAAPILGGSNLVVPPALRAAADRRAAAAAPPMRATAPAPVMPPMPVAPSLNASGAPVNTWVAEVPAADDFAAIAAQARMGMQARSASESSRNGKGRVLIACTAAIAVAGAVFAFQTVYDPGRKEREAREAAISAEAARLAEAQRAKDNLSRLEIEVESAIMANKLDAARSSLASLTALAPNHPRREFLNASINRAAELAALSSPQVAASNAPRTRSVLSEDEARAQRVTTRTSNPRPVAAAPRPRPNYTGTAEPALPVARRPDTSFGGRTLEASDSAQRAPTRAAASASTSIPPGVSGISTAPNPVIERAPAPVPPPIGASIASAVPGATANVPTPVVPVNVTPAKVIKRVNPVMPSVALSRKLKGFVVLSYTVDTDGKVRDVEVVESTPERIFDIAASEAVRKWTYEPRKENGVPVDAKTKVKIIFE